MLLFICSGGTYKVISLNDRKFTLIDKTLDPNYDGVYTGKIVRYSFEKKIPIIEPLNKVCRSKSEQHVRNIIPLIERIYFDSNVYDCDLCTLRLINGILNGSINLDFGFKVLDILKKLSSKILEPSMYLSNEDTTILNFVFKAIKIGLLSEENSEQLVTELSKVLTTQAPTDGLKFIITDAKEEIISFEDARKRMVNVTFLNQESKRVNLMEIMEKSQNLCYNCTYGHNTEKLYLKPKSIYLCDVLS